MTATAIARIDTGEVVGYAPSNYAVVLDLAPVKVSRKLVKAERTCQAPVLLPAGVAGPLAICGNVLGLNGETRRARTGQRFCSDHCQRVGQRYERHTETEDYGRMTQRIVRSYGKRAAGEFDQIGQLSEIAAEADRALRAAVAGARARGLSWTVIGDQLGISRQGAQQRFGK